MSGEAQKEEIKRASERRTELRLRARLRKRSERLRGPAREWVRTNYQRIWEASGKNPQRAVQMVHAEAQPMFIAEILVIIQFVTLLFKVLEIFGIWDGWGNDDDTEVVEVQQEGASNG